MSNSFPLFFLGNSITASILATKEKSCLITLDLLLIFCPKCYYPD